MTRACGRARSHNVFIYKILLFYWQFALKIKNHYKWRSGNKWYEDDRRTNESEQERKMKEKRKNE